MRKILMYCMCFMLSTSVVNVPIYASDGTNTGDAQPEQEISLYQADINKPVLDSITLPDHGKTLQAGSTTPIYVKAHDSDSGIKTVQVKYYIELENGKGQSETLTLTYNEATKQFEGVLPVVEGGYVKESICSIYIEDHNFNYVEQQLEAVNYQINITNTKTVELNNDKIKFSQQAKTLSPNDSFTLEFTLPSDIASKVTSITGKFSGYDTICFSAYPNENGIFQATYTLGANVASGTYKLDTSTIQLHMNDYQVQPVISESVSYYFDVVNDTPIEEKTDVIKPQITSIKVDKNKEIVHSGDQVNIVIEASDNEALDTARGTVELRTPSDIQNDSKTISLSYDQAQNAFVGVFEIDENTYAGEWYIRNVNIYDESENVTSLIAFTNNEYPYYVIVNQAGTVVNPMHSISFTFYALDANGEYVKVSTWNKDQIEHRSTIKDAGLTIPDGTTTYRDLTFKEWRDTSGRIINENTEIVEDGMYNGVYAVYDKRVMNTKYSYMNEVGVLSEKEMKILINETPTYEDYFNAVNEQAPTDYYKQASFTGWKLDTKSTVDPREPMQFMPLETYVFNDTYENKIIVNTVYSYYGQDARKLAIKELHMFDEGTTYAQFYEEIKQKAAPVSYEGLRFSGWGLSTYYNRDEVIEKNYDLIPIFAEYENHIVRFILDDTFKSTSGMVLMFEEPKWEYFHGIVAEEGEIIKIPEFEGYKNVTFAMGQKDTKIGDEITVDGNLTYYGYGDKVDTPNTPETPDSPETPDQPSDSSNSSKPDEGSRPSIDVIKDTINLITNAKEGETIEVSMQDSTILPAEYLMALKGKNINLKLQMGTYSWTINGLDVVAESLKDINMEVNLNTNAIPSKLVKQLSGNNPTKQLSLTHNGDFGFKADLQFNIGKEYQGMYGNLYYYDSEGKLVFMNAGSIEKDGMISLSFSHASDYVVVIDKKSPIVNTASSSQASGMMLMILLAGGYAYYEYDKKRKASALKNNKDQ